MAASRRARGAYELEDGGTGGKEELEADDLPYRDWRQADALRGQTRGFRAIVAQLCMAGRLGEIGER